MGRYSETALVIAALLPAILLCVYVYKKDRVEKEPPALLLKLLLFGVITCAPAGVIEEMIIGFIDSVFKVEEASYVLPKNTFYVYNALKYFIGVALVEEGLKYLFLLIGTKNHKDFDNFFDGLIYSVFVSLGFAALENVMYVTQYGFGNAVMRGILSVPGHMFFAVMMGYYYSLGSIVRRACDYEEALLKKGLVFRRNNRLSYKKYGYYCVIVPTLAHGLYDFCCTVGETWATLLLVAFVIFMYIHCFGRIKKMSKQDAPINSYAKALLIRLYPEHKSYIIDSI